MSPRRPARPGRISFVARSAILLAILAVLASACSALLEEAPEPTPADFPGIAAEIAQRGIVIEHLVSGDAGCDDRVLNPTAIGLDARGLDQDEPVRLYFYIFRNRASYERLRGSIDECARSYVTDPATFESLEASPFVVAGQGPWAPAFEAALRDAVTEAAGTGD